MRVALDSFLKVIARYWYVPFVLLLIISGFNLSYPIFGAMSTSAKIHSAVMYIVIAALMVGIYIDFISGRKLMIKSLIFIFVLIEASLGRFSYIGLNVKMLHNLFFWIGTLILILVVYFKKHLTVSRIIDDK